MGYPNHRYMSIAKDIKMREQCTGSTQEFVYCIPNKAAFAIALKGNVDLNSETKRMKLIMGVLAEAGEPDWKTILKVSSQIVDLTPGRNYAILKFEKSSDVPQKNFLAIKTWTNSW